MAELLFITATRQYQCPGRIVGFTVYRSGILALVQGNSSIIALDHDLKFLWKKDRVLRWREGMAPRLSVNHGCSLMGIAEADSVRVMAMDGTLLFRQEHDAWGAFQGTNVFFSDRYVYFITPGAKNDLLIVLDNHFYLVSSKDLPGNRENQYTFHGTTDPGIIMLEVSAGQDECLLLLIKEHAGKIRVEELTVLRDRIMGGFSPDGGVFVTSPHCEEGLEWYSFPPVKRVGAMSQPELFADRNTLMAEERDSLDYQTIFVADRLIAALTRFGRILLVSTDTHKVVAECRLQDMEPKGYKKDGGRTQDPRKIAYYESDIAFLQFLAPRRLLALHTSGKLLSYSFPPVGLR